MNIFLSGFSHTILEWAIARYNLALESVITLTEEVSRQVADDLLGQGKYLGKACFFAKFVSFIF